MRRDLEERARGASWRKTGAQLAAGGVLLLPLVFAASLFNPLSGFRLVVAVVAPAALVGAGLACFWLPARPGRRR